MPHFARSRYGSTFIRSLLILAALLFVALSALAYTSNVADRLALTGIGLVTALACGLTAVFVTRLGAR